MTKCIVVKLENKINPMIAKTICGYNTIDHAFEFCGVDKNYWNIVEVKETEVNG